MKNLVTQIKILNQVYKDMKHNFDTLKKMFKKDSCIGQKIILSEQILGQAYMEILKKIETNEINSQFFDIIKDIRKNKNG